MNNVVVPYILFRISHWLFTLKSFGTLTGLQPTEID